MIVVTGATGLLGGAVVERLLARQPDEEIGVNVRDPAKAGALADRGVRVRRGDYDDAASLAHAFEGAEQLLLVSAAATGETALRQHRTAIDAARRAGVRRVVYTSHMGANPASAFAPMVDHAATEALLDDSGLAFTALRNGFYAASGRMLLGRAVETLDGARLRVEIDTICVHGDTPGAVAMARRIKHALVSVGVELAPMAALLAGR